MCIRDRLQSAIRQSEICVSLRYWRARSQPGSRKALEHPPFGNPHSERATPLKGERLKSHATAIAQQ
eukprot:5247501-Alexandrium_andersonii.AAC.1